MYTGYYYNPNRDMDFPGDVNELYVGGKFIHYITAVRTSDHIEELAPNTEVGEKLVLITSDLSEDIVTNFNPSPETPFNR